MGPLINCCPLTLAALDLSTVVSTYAYLLTGGIGLAAGAAFGGGRYEYRDAFNLPAGDVKTKYKGPELQKLEQSAMSLLLTNMTRPVQRLETPALAVRA